MSTDRIAEISAEKTRLSEEMSVLLKQKVALNAEQDLLHAQAGYDSAVGAAEAVLIKAKAAQADAEGTS